MDEFVRMIKGFQMAEKEGVVIPANWSNNELVKDEVIMPPAGSEEMIEKRKDQEIKERLNATTGGSVIKRRNRFNLEEAVQPMTPNLSVGSLAYVHKDKLGQWPVIEPEFRLVNLCYLERPRWVDGNWYLNNRCGEFNLLILSGLSIVATLPKDLYPPSDGEAGLPFPQLL